MLTVALSWHAMASSNSCTRFGLSSQRIIKCEFNNMPPLGNVFLPFLISILQRFNFAFLFQKIIDNSEQHNFKGLNITYCHLYHIIIMAIFINYRLAHSFTFLFLSFLTLWQMPILVVDLLLQQGGHGL